MSRNTTRRVRSWIAVGALMAPAVMLAAASASSAANPASPPAGCTGSPDAINGPTFTCTYNSADFTNPITFTVPTGVTSLDITATGGAGGTAFGGARGGAGASVHRAELVA